MGYVYLILETDKYGEERYKIGMTKRDPQKRVKELSTGNSNVVTLLHDFKSIYYKNIEKMLHVKFKGQKTEANNEWFVLEDEQVLKFKSTCEEIEKTVILLKENNPFYK
jgi:hypothetical protein